METEASAAKVAVKKTAKKADSKKVDSKKTDSKKEAPKKAVAKTESKKTDTKGDDLTKIAGIGKVYQGKLNDEGIFTYTDVVNMTQTQIDTMEEKYTFKGDFKDAIADAKNFVTGKDA